MFNKPTISSNLFSFPIQTMVALMGAQFSKPLVANKITHLICYKFEGKSFYCHQKCFQQTLSCELLYMLVLFVQLDSFSLDIFFLLH